MSAVEQHVVGAGALPGSVNALPQQAPPRPYARVSIDPELVVRAQSHDREAQEELVSRLAPLVFRLVGRFFWSRDDVEDLAQDSFVRFFSKIDQVRPGDNVAGWVSRVTVNVCYDRLRKIRRERLALDDFRYQPRTRPVDADPDGRLAGALARLDANLKVPLMLKEIEGHSVREISEMMGITQSNVKIRLYRARKKMSAMLGAGAATAA